MRAAYFGLHMVNLAGEAVRRKPFTHGIGIEKCSIDTLRRSTEHTVKPDGIRGHDYFAFFSKG
jgi:hypothetical protein